MQPFDIRVGCSGWQIPKAHAQHFPSGKSHLERSPSRFLAVEITSSFYKPHRAQTYARWAAAVPEHFQFAVKMPKEITHEHRLADLARLDAFLSEISALGAKLGPLLVQLPPKLEFNVALPKCVAPDFQSNSTSCSPRSLS